LPTSLIACRDCGTIQGIRPPPRGTVVACRQCGRVLENSNGRSLDAALACAIATFLLLLPTNLTALMTVRVAGIVASTQLGSGVAVAWRQGWPLIAIVLGLVGIVLPLLRFGLLSVTLTAIRLGARGPRVGRAFRYCEALDQWAMSDVLLIGAGIGYGRIASQISVHIDAGGWCLVGAAAMTMLTRATMERQAVWRCLEMPAEAEPPARDALACTSCDLVLPSSMAGRRCPRCDAVVHRRRPGSVQSCAALLIATAILTPIAYGYPMSELWEFGRPDPHSVIDGIRMLFQSGFWYFGVVITLVSLIFPLTKLVALTWFLTSIWRHSSRRLRTKTRLYRFIDEVGRWSTLDPFTVLVFAPMAQFNQTAHIDFMGGSAAFLSTVVLSMLASHTLDARLMWDAAEVGRQRWPSPSRVGAAAVRGISA
jgi:paraquat-inducible protein A